MLCKWIPGCLDTIQVFSLVPGLHKADTPGNIRDPFSITHNTHRCEILFQAWGIFPQNWL